MEITAAGIEVENVMPGLEAEIHVRRREDHGDDDADDEPAEGQFADRHGGGIACSCTRVSPCGGRHFCRSLAVCRCGRPYSADCRNEDGGERGFGGRAGAGALKYVGARNGRSMSRRVLFALHDWGLGHAARSLVLIRPMIERGDRVTVLMAASAGHATAEIRTRRCLRVLSVRRHPQALQPLSGDVLRAHEPVHALGVGTLQAGASPDRTAGPRTRLRPGGLRQPLRRVVARGAELLHLPFAAPDHSGPSAVDGTPGRMGPARAAQGIYQGADTRRRGGRRTRRAIWAIIPSSTGARGGCSLHRPACPGSGARMARKTSIISSPSRASNRNAA